MWVDGFTDSKPTELESGDDDGGGDDSNSSSNSSSSSSSSGGGGGGDGSGGGGGVVMVAVLVVVVVVVVMVVAMVVVVVVVGREVRLGAHPMAMRWDGLIDFRNVRFLDPRNRPIFLNIAPGISIFQDIES
ncbi:hypothetical protein HZH68_005818 [Vespula germanica]|uniref:Uncharacterized protein n=1 Tax=Vespula germanica TaxID=30212 RepID=A0A834KEF7_VESGE|nr:hypothetical protein HZH68_005818 [Vespula germanica]